MTHVSGIKKWSDSTSTWVDVTEDDCWMVGRNVHLSDGTSVTDGDPRVHWGERWNEKEWEQEEMVH